MNGQFPKSFLTLALALFGVVGAANAQLPPPGLASPQAGPSTQSGSSSSGSTGTSQTQSPAAPQAQSPFAGSVPGKLVPGILPISLQDAIDRGLKQNLGALLSSQDVTAARGTRWQKLSDLLPHVTASPLVDVSQVNLKEFGFSNFPGVNIPSIVGPFSYFDVRANLSQQVFDWKAINATRAMKANASLKSRNSR